MVTVQKAIKIVGITMMIGLLGKILAFVRELVVANHFGVSAAMDVFNIANNIPDILLSGIGVAISTTFIPIFTQKAERDGMEEAVGLSRKILSISCLIGIFICCLGIFFAEPLTHLMAPKFNTNQIRLTSKLTRILLTTGAFSVITGLCVGFLQARERFIIPAFIGIPFNVAKILIIILLAKDYGVYSLAIAGAIAIGLQFIFILPSARRAGFNFTPSLDYKDPDLKRVVNLTLPVIVGNILFQISIIVDRVFASGLPVGSISALNYATRIITLIVSIVAADIATISLPTLTQAVAVNNMNKLRHTMLQAVRGINFIMIPVTIGILVLRVPLVQLIYQRGAFDEQATMMTATALCYLSLGLFAYGLREIFSRVFYALNDTVTPVLNSVVTIAFNILLIFILTPPFGMAGLAGATSISGTFSGIQLLFRLRRKIGNVHGVEIARSFLSIIFASIVMGFIMTLLYSFIQLLNPGAGFISRLLILIITSSIGAPFYLLVLFFLRSEEISLITAILKQQLPKALRKNG